MSVPECIAELLLNHNLVTITGFGTIAAKREGSSIHPVENSFRPPHKNFSFDGSAKNENEILAEELARRNAIEKTESLKSIRDFVEEMEGSLKEKGAYELKGIGKFYFDVEKKLQFAAHPAKNYLLSSYGLPEFISKTSLRRENIPSYAANASKQKKKSKRFFWFRF